MAIEGPEGTARTLLCGDAVEIGSHGRVTLIGGRCSDCGAQAFPRVSVCSACMGENVVAERMPSTGTLYAFSTVHVAPRQWKQPMRVGYVDLPNGVRVFTHLDGAGFAIGDKVEAGTGIVGQDKDGPIETFVFRKVGR